MRFIHYVTFSIAHVQKDPVVEPVNTQDIGSSSLFQSQSDRTSRQSCRFSQPSLTQLTGLIKCSLFSVKIAAGYWTPGQNDWDPMDIHHRKWVSRNHSIWPRHDTLLSDLLISLTLRWSRWGPAVKSICYSISHDCNYAIYIVCVSLITVAIRQTCSLDTLRWSSICKPSTVFIDLSSVNKRRSCETRVEITGLDPGMESVQDSAAAVKRGQCCGHGPELWAGWWW